MANPNEAIREQIRTILTDRCQISIDSESSGQNIHLDSMALMELIVGLENKFDIMLENDKLGDFYRSPSLDSITQLVTEQTTV